jgi:hypothetical protein
MTGRYTPPKASPAQIVDRLMAEGRRPEADQLIAQARFVLQGVVGHDVTVAEARAFMAGCSYVTEMARVAKLSERAQSMVHASVEVAMAVAAGIVEDLVVEQGGDPMPPEPSDLSTFTIPAPKVPDDSPGP